MPHSQRYHAKILDYQGSCFDLVKQYSASHRNEMAFASRRHPRIATTTNAKSKPLMYSNDKATNQEIEEHLAKIKTLVIATRDARSLDPDASYAPYVEHQGKFYVLISLLAAHTKNVLAYPRCHALFIADEQSSPNLFARKRVSFRCSCNQIDRTETPGKEALAKLRDKFGPIIDMISGLGDFHLIQLTPESGTYVKGFGQAFPLQVSIDPSL